MEKIIADNFHLAREERLAAYEEGMRIFYEFGAVYFVMNIISAWGQKEGLIFLLRPDGIVEKKELSREAKAEQVVSFQDESEFLAFTVLEPYASQGLTQDLMEMLKERKFEVYEHRNTIRMVKENIHKADFAMMNEPPLVTRLNKKTELLKRLAHSLNAELLINKPRHKFMIVRPFKTDMKWRFLRFLDALFPMNALTMKHCDLIGYADDYSFHDFDYVEIREDVFIKDKNAPVIKALFANYPHEVREVKDPKHFKAHDRSAAIFVDLLKKQKESFLTSDFDGYFSVSGSEGLPNPFLILKFEEYERFLERRKSLQYRSLSVLWDDYQKKSVFLVPGNTFLEVKDINGAKHRGVFEKIDAPDGGGHVMAIRRGVIRKEFWAQDIDLIRILNPFDAAMMVGEIDVRLWKFLNDIDEILDDFSQDSFDDYAGEDLDEEDDFPDQEENILFSGVFLNLERLAGLYKEEGNVPDFEIMLALLKALGRSEWQEERLKKFQGFIYVSLQEIIGDFLSAKRVTDQIQFQLTAQESSGRNKNKLIEDFAARAVQKFSQDGLTMADDYEFLKEFQIFIGMIKNQSRRAAILGDMLSVLKEKFPARLSADPLSGILENLSVEAGDDDVLHGWLSFLRKYLEKTPYEPYQEMAYLFYLVIREELEHHNPLMIEEALPMFRPLILTKNRRDMEWIESQRLYLSAFMDSWLQGNIDVDVEDEMENYQVKRSVWEKYVGGEMNVWEAVVLGERGDIGTEDQFRSVLADMIAFKFVRKYNLTVADHSGDSALIIYYSLYHQDDFLSVITDERLKVYNPQLSDEYIRKIFEETAYEFNRAWMVFKVFDQVLESIDQEGAYDFSAQGLSYYSGSPIIQVHFDQQSSLVFELLDDKLGEIFSEIRKAIYDMGFSMKPTIEELMLAVDTRLLALIPAPQDISEKLKGLVEGQAIRIVLRNGTITEGVFERIAYISSAGFVHLKADESIAFSGDSVPLADIQAISVVDGAMMEEHDSKSDLGGINFDSAQVKWDVRSDTSDAAQLWSASALPKDFKGFIPVIMKIETISNPAAYFSAPVPIAAK